MSEYQYYEFQALDRPLSEAERRELRRVSSRATITATHFANHYEWGDLKADPAVWMEKFFDAFVYVANWSTHELMLRLPRSRLDPGLAKRYCAGQSASVRSKGDFVILSFCSEDEGGGEDWHDGRAWLTGLVPLRAELAAGDHRALYLAWLMCLQNGEIDEGESEPPVPPGLGRLSASLRSFADFLRIDPDLIAASAESSNDTREKIPRDALERWITALPPAQKDDWLKRLARGEAHLHAEFVARFRAAQPQSETGAAARTARQIMEAAEQRTRERQRQQAGKNSQGTCSPRA